MMRLAAIIEKIKYLPPLDQQDALSYIQGLIKKNQIKKHTPPTFSWAGCLQGEDVEFSSIEIQHKIRNMWIDEIAL
ncbi:MAG: hypothetical protein STSR0009_03510 [Methanoregula sp.]